MSTIAIHQAHFLPWLPYFALLHKVEVFVVLDDVKYKPRYYVNRTKIVNKNTRELEWVTIPTIGTQSTITKDVLIERDKFFSKALNKVTHNYRRCRFFNYWYEIECILSDRNITHLLHLNVQLLKHLLGLLGLSAPEIKFSSNLLDVKPECRTHRYELICKATGCNKILSGIGMAKNVHDIDKLNEQGIILIGMKKEAILRHAIEIGLSIIDSILCNGLDETREKIISFSNSAFKSARRSS